VHIQHDITIPFPIPDNSVDGFQDEDVLEHIDYDCLVSVLNEIHRVLKPNGLIRLSVPDYGCDVLQLRSVKDVSGNIVFDPEGGGTPEAPGHVWFPRINLVRNLIQKSAFNRHGTVDYLHYYNIDGSFVVKPVDYSKGYIDRTPDHDERVKFPYRPMSMIIDLIKCGTPLKEMPLSHLSKPYCEDAGTKTTGQSENPTCIFINTYYQAFLDSLYAKIPALHTESYCAQIMTLQAQYFGDSDFYSGGLKKAGWVAGDLIINCNRLQQAWEQENEFSGEGLGLVSEQIRRITPNVVYFQD
jgi:predicted SAM-dependent methyltransferase